MDLFLAICQGIGLALAVGLGGPIAAFAAATLDHVDLLWELEGTEWEWVSSPAFIALLAVLALAGHLLRGHRLAPRLMPLIAAALGAILFAASMAERGEAVWIGLVGGAALAYVTWRVVAEVLEGARTRATRDPDGSVSRRQGVTGLLSLWAALAGITLAVLATLAPPSGLIALILLAALAIARRARSNRRYAGLRSLR